MLPWRHGREHVEKLKVKNAPTLTHINRFVYEITILLFLFSKVVDTVCGIVCVCPLEALQKEKVDREEQWLQELDEDEYDALPEEQKERITERHREKLRQQKLRYWLEDWWMNGA